MIYKHKRHHTRAIPDPEHPVIVNLVGENFIDTIRAKDIGEGGLSVYVPYQFQGCVVDREVAIIITLPKVRSFKATGMIRHKGKKQGFYFGIAFTDIKDKDLQQLMDYIKERAELGSIVK